jgi:hypothetical protein
MKNRILSVSLGVGFLLCGIAISVTANAGQKLQVLAPGTYTIAKLLETIRGNSSNANFFVPANGKTPLKAADFNANPGKMNASLTIDRAGLMRLIENTATPVDLKRTSDAHINFLKDKNQKRIRGFGKDYSNLVRQVMLYFEIGDYPLFLFDPYPGKMIGTRGATSPIVPMLDKWQVSGVPVAYDDLAAEDTPVTTTQASQATTSTSKQAGKKNK